MPVEKRSRLGRRTARLVRALAATGLALAVAVALVAISLAQALPDVRAVLAQAAADPPALVAGLEGLVRRTVGARAVGDCAPAPGRHGVKRAAPCATRQVAIVER
jgi:hypothetical protein